MPDFSKAFRDGRRSMLPNGDVRWMMSGMGEGVLPGEELRALWWIGNAGCEPTGDGRPTVYRGVRVWLSIRDAALTTALRIEVWTQPAVTGTGILLDELDVVPVAGADPSQARDLGVWGVPLETLGLRSRVTVGAGVQVSCEATFYLCSLGASGRLWLGEGVTAV